jgi:hypothetical protein
MLSLLLKSTEPMLDRHRMTFTLKVEGDLLKSTFEYFSLGGLETVLLS